MKRLNQAYETVVEAFESVIDRSKLGPEVQCSHLERFIDGLAVVALYGRKEHEVQAVQVDQSENEQV